MQKFSSFFAKIFVTRVYIFANSSYVGPTQNDKVNENRRGEHKEENKEGLSFIKG
jgi:hypothetical protein